MQFRLNTWWKEHAPGDIVDAAIDEIHALLCVGGADPIKPAEQSAKEAQAKAVEVTPDEQSGTTDQPA
jgi:hypothetical protein